ncbi:MAG: helix-turn-helix transcriptional regulator, partial [Oscillospiraceae bacterium]|nr:helix-turn-helix transcriptional regulator [Oscillospiraceae bacterium]
TGLTASYISRIFHKETSLTVTDYILSKRVETAQNMLRYSDMPPVEIANLLAFSSHSHFISIFRKYTGMTPNRYREENYRANDLTDL